MASQRDVKNKIASVKNIQKITRAMEMVAAARLRRAEQRIAALRPYADAIRRMTRQAAHAAGAEAARLPLLHEHESVRERRPAARHRRPRPRGRLQLADHPRRRAPRGRADGRGQDGVLVCDGAPRRVLARLPRPRAQRHLHRLRRPPRLRRRAHDRRRPDRRPTSTASSTASRSSTTLHLAAHPAGHPRTAAAALTPR